ncbi:MAG: hydantoinase/oxoprolinase family protein, partial [Candidatus Eremiobacteraeota bacterium]|nr:hydantoinase/oxoprolinase family protein [Candidatus Eremiobacteraeota bacterium]
LAAYLQPLMAGYLVRLEEQLAGRGSRRFWVVHSAGAVMTAAEASQAPNAVVLSGPAAGVRGAFTVASACGHTQLLTLDMGGTSTDVSLCPGRVATVTWSSLEDVPVRQPMIDIHTVGAGGGSIAWLDAGGALQVGPESAGSDPGPAAYGRGHRPTVTDAHLVLGRLPTELAGGVKLDKERARQALASLAEPLGCSPEEAAAGVLRVAATHMERALRVISIERGFDPRGFTLVPFGGAGPLQACELAERLGVKTVLLAPSPGVLSALGAAVAPWLREFSRTVLGAEIEPIEAQLRDEARQQMGQVELDSLVDLRYRGQGSELTLPLGEQLEERFHQAHQQRYGYHRSATPVERVTLRVRASQPRPVPNFEPPTEPARQLGTQSVWHDGQELDCRLFERGLFNQPEPGPAVILQYDTTTFVPPGWSIHQAGACLRLEPS